MKSIAIIIPYFGKLPDYFPLWLESCRYNNSIDFLLFTDDQTFYNYPENVKVNYCDFTYVKGLIQRCVDFDISLKSAYKLCDFRPLYGDAFKEYLSSYDFWGHCDIDLIWGDIRQFISNDKLENYNRLFNQGHCILYKNNDEVNTWYKTLDPKNHQCYQSVFTTNKSCSFDEQADHMGGGISRIIESNGIPIYDDTSIIADLSTSTGKFDVIFWDKNPKCFYYDNGKLFALFNDNLKKEILYTHFQKRSITFKNKNFSNYFLNAPGFIENEYNKNKIECIKFDIGFNLNRVKRKIKKSLN